jgi:hypothetical protein
MISVSRFERRRSSLAVTLATGEAVAKANRNVTAANGFIVKVVWRRTS